MLAYMKMFRRTDAATTRGPADWFSGEAWIQSLLGADDSATQRSAVVSFASGARTSWHTHPLGQMIFVVSGICLAQKHGEAVQRFSAGDAVWFAPGEKHWHGSEPGSPMVHLAVQQADEAGNVVEWLEHVEG